MHETDFKLPRIKEGVFNLGKEAEDKDAIQYKNQEATKNQDKIEAIIERQSSLI